MKPNLLTPADVLDAAADYITAYGWCQDQYFDVDTLSFGMVYPPACALGAIFQVTGERDAVRVLGEYINSIRQCTCPIDINPDDCACDDIESVDVWNDTHGRTADEVSATMHNAAEAWRAAQSGGAA
ncbi:hypothetical protein AB0M43_22185 [Longispora sp. NPDC051575]|uniref:DUF6197 family protein n=1 Tax=Longispora sp. NPDC051575 TaxID=3154943 RepID=UPI0034324729